MQRFGAWDTYCAMYAAFEERFEPGDGLPEKARRFLSDSNPHLWGGEVSADPALYGEFRRTFEAMFPTGEAEPCESADAVEDFLASMQELYRFVDDVSDDPDVDFWAVFDEVTEELSWPHFFGIEPAIGTVNPKVLQEDELALLGSLIGGTMGRYQRYDLLRNGAFWEYAGVEVDGITYELSATNVCVSWYKDLEDYCPLRFRRLGEGEPIGSSPGVAALTRVPVGKAIRDVLVCTETEVSYCDGRAGRNVDTRAIAFVFDDGEQLVFDRGWYFSEMMEAWGGRDAMGRVERSGDEEGYEEDGHLFRSEHSLAWRSLAAGAQGAISRHDPGGA